MWFEAIRGLKAGEVTNGDHLANLMGCKKVE